MAPVKIMTDSVACIPQEIAQKYGIRIVPAGQIMFNNHTYLDGVTIQPSEAYQLVRKNPDVYSTSAITPGYLIDVYRSLRQETNQILFVTVSSALSAVFKTASLAADVLKQEAPQTVIRIIDSKTVAGAESLLVIAAAQAAAQGKNSEEIAQTISLLRARTNGLMLLDTMRFIYRTGRMSKLAARVAAMLNIRPINKVSDNGTIEFVDRVRNRESGIQKVMELVRQAAGTRDVHFALNHADDLEYATQFVAHLKANFNCLSLTISEYSPIMGWGTGPGAIFVGFRPSLDL
jgi:DegV family protein with EDD domain